MVTPSVDAAGVPARSRLACATHELIGVIGDRWSVLVLIELGDRGVLRSAELKRSLDGVSQKVLTDCLRRLQTRGFIERTTEATVPVSVRYELSAFGKSFFAAFSVLRAWADDHVEQLDPAMASSPPPAPPTRPA